MNIRDEIQKHQEATGASGDVMIKILIGFLEHLDEGGYLNPDWPESLFDFISESLHVGPPS